MRGRAFVTTLLFASAFVACNARTFGDESDGSGTGTGDGCEPGDLETCDGLDNDCDGSIDEDIMPVICGVGSCAASVSCIDGEMPACVPGEPSEEACNLADDDCDGQVDEGLGFGPLADPIVLRSQEGSTGDCTSCSWAFGAGLAPTDEGFLAVWNLGLLGGSRMPNVYGRRVDFSGMPTGPVELLRDDFVLHMSPMQALDPLPAKGLVWSGQVREQDDLSALLFAHASGGTEITSPVPGYGPRNRERFVWTGQRFITSWEDEDELRVAVLNEDGTLDHMVEVDPLVRPGAITLGVYPGRVGVLVSRVRVELELWDQWFILLDSLGNVSSPAHEIDVEYETWQSLVGTEGGWLHIRPNDHDEASTRQPLDPEGHPTEEATPFEAGEHAGDSGSADVFVPRPGLHEMITAWSDPFVGGTMHVEFLDDRGEFLRGWSGPLQPDPDFEVGWLAEPHIQFVGERVLVIWHGLAGHAQANPIYVREFGCVP